MLQTPTLAPTDPAASRKGFVLAICLLGFLVGRTVLAGQGLAPRTVGSVDFEPCPAGPLAQVTGSSEALCGTHEVFENREARSGRKIGLKITLVPALEPSTDGSNAPVFPLAGGPGEAAHNTALGAYFTLQPSMRTRDMVIVDIRGTGGSNPLRCQPLGPPDRIQSWIFYIIPRDEAERCAEVLSEHSDLTQYTTSYAADDLNEVREALGYESFALWGASYGTVLGQEIIRRHGEFVDTAVLLGIGPMDMHAPMGFARSLETTRERLVADCSENVACAEAYPDFEAQLDAMLEAARTSPVSATVVSPISGEREPVSLEYGDFVMGVRFLLYNAAAAGSLPGWVASANEGDYAPIMQNIANSVAGIRQVLHYGLFLSMRCAEDLPYVDTRAEREDAMGTMLGTYRMDRELENCTVWPRGELTGDRHSPVQSDVPVLLLSGSEDPVTPPEYGDRVAAGLPNALHVVFENRGHGFFDPRAVACLHAIVGPFLDGVPRDSIDTSCAASLERLPFNIGTR